MNSIPQVPLPRNEPVLGYAPGSPERAELKAALKVMASEEIEIPLIIGGREVRTGDTDTQVMPHDHGHVLARYHKAGEGEVRQAVAAALEAQREWAAWPWEDRLAVFLRAADLLAGSWRPVVNAATMLGQSKTAHQAEIDAACELIDFYRFNAAFAQRLFSEQPLSGPGMWNRLDHRPLEGFVYAVTPFNFTSIAGNLPTAPAMVGNVAVWKPAASTVYSGWYLMRLLMEAGLPPGVINFVPGDPVATSGVLLNDPHLAGVHFTGSTAVFQNIWKTVGDNIASYKSYPRLVGET
ncbi:MAG TPA: aldehyde dehydrogenase family protein, partial [Longimicrobium sp.]|nr:aldehyde dehydrogenase family protein [Longimicrobium sp.]